eukprot:3225803-Pyramimonas_sp.AAC.1
MTDQSDTGDPTAGLDTDVQRPAFRASVKNLGGKLNSPVVEWLNKGLMAVSSPTSGGRTPEQNCGRTANLGKLMRVMSRIVTPVVSSRWMPFGEWWSPLRWYLKRAFE